MRKKIEETAIFEAAKKVFAEFDFKKATLQDIADELSVTNSNLYLYFDGKKELYNATVRFYLKKWLNKCFAQLVSIKDPRQQIVFLLKNCILYLTEDEGLSEILKKDESILGTIATSERFADVYAEAIEHISDIIHMGTDLDLIRGLDARSAAAALINIYIWLVIRPTLLGEKLNNSVLEDVVKYGLFMTM